VKKELETHQHRMIKNLQCSTQQAQISEQPATTKVTKATPTIQPTIRHEQETAAKDNLGGTKPPFSLRSKSR